MKKTLLATLTLAGATLLFSGTALAATDANTKGQVTYGEGSLVIDPDPTDPETGGPIDPETGNPETEQPGGNMNSRLPKNLNFGYHANQTLFAERYTARNLDTTGLTSFDDLKAAYDAANDTVGALLVEDNRNTPGDWTVTVGQPEEFEDAASSKKLGSTLLEFNTGAIWNSVDAAGTGLTPTAAVSIAPTAATSLVLTAGAGSGVGMTKLDLSKFELEVPAGVDKGAGEFTADINWTVTSAP